MSLKEKRSKFQIYGTHPTRTDMSIDCGIVYAEKQQDVCDALTVVLRNSPWLDRFSPYTVTRVSNDKG